MSKEYVWYSPFHDQLFVCGADECREYKSCNWRKCPGYFFDIVRTGWTSFVISNEAGAMTGVEEIVWDERYYMGDL